jgi:hypothetical protein
MDLVNFFKSQKIMWKTLFIIAIVTATLEWVFVILGEPVSGIVQAILWNLWAGFCFIKWMTKNKI